MGRLTTYVRGAGRGWLVFALVVTVLLGAGAQAFASSVPGGGSYAPLAPLNAPTSISVSLNSSSLEVGDSTLALATCNPVGSNQSVTWTSSDPDIASVDRLTGVVDAHALGRVAIIATSVDFSGGSIVGYTMLEVVPTMVTSINTSWDSSDSTYTVIMVNDWEYAYVDSVLPSDATTGTYTWSSSNTNVATVDNDGQVWGVSSGLATITATAEDGSGVTSSLVVRVYQPIDWVDVYVNGSDYIYYMSDTDTATVSLGFWPEDVSYDRIWYEIPTSYYGDLSDYVSIDATTGVITPVAGSRTYSYLHFHVLAHMVNANGVADYTVWSSCIYITPTWVTSIDVTLSDSSISKSGSATATAAILPSDASNKSVSWWSSDTDIASVDASGNITPHAAGTVNIWASANDGSEVEDYATLTVEPTPLTSIDVRWDNSLSTTTTVLAQGDSLYAELYAYTPNDADDTGLVWSSSDTDVATVDSDGEVHAVGNGTATITGSSDDGSELSDSVVVTVYTYATSLYIYEVGGGGSIDLYDSESTTMTADVYPSDATTQTVTWSWYNISDGAYASIDATTGVITPVSGSVLGGYAHIHAKGTIVGGGVNGEDVWDTVCVYIWPTQVTSIDVTLSDSSISKSGSATATAAVLPAGASNKSVSWWSSDTDIASVDASGNITPHAAGTVNIWASANDGSEVEDYETLTVEPTPLTAIEVRWENSLSTTTTVLAQGDSLYAELYTFTPYDADDTSLTWSSSDTEVATVDSDGEVHAVGNGTATITGSTDDGSELESSVTVTVFTYASEVDAYEAGGDQWVEIYDSESTTMVADVYPSDATTQTVTWSWYNISDATYASIDATTGVITPNPDAIFGGYVHIHAKATVVGGGVGGSDVWDTACVYIWETPVAVTSITVTAAKTTIGIGYDTTVTASIEPTTATNQDFWWDTSDDDIATVDQYGYVYGVSPGTVRITAYADDGSEVSGYVDITVARIYVSNIAVTLADNSIPIGNDTTASATIAPFDATDKSFTWLSTNPSVATIDPETGEIHGVKAGRVRIVAAADDDGAVAGYATLDVTADSPVDTVDVALDPSTVMVGEYSKATATIMPLDAFSMNVTWSTSDESIATIDEDGDITAVSAGEVTIIATSDEYTPTGMFAPLLPASVVGTATLTVTPLPPVLVTKITVSVAANVLTAGQTTQASAVVLPDNAADQDVVWSTSDDTIASIDASGVITTLKAGVVEIIATAADGSGVTDGETITVNAVPVPVRDILTAPVLSTTAVKAGKQFYIKSTIKPKYALNTAPAVAVIQKKNAKGGYTTVAGVKLYVTANTSTTSTVGRYAVIKTKGTYRVRIENTGLIKVFTVWKTFTVK